MKVYIGPYRKNRKVSIRIDSYDVWNMDHTLSFIIHPMLIKLNEVKQGAPNVDDEDVPEHLRSTSAPPKEDEWGIDSLHFDRWDWVMNEMIWAFGEEIDDTSHKFFNHPENLDEGSIDHFIKNMKVDREGLDAYEERKKKAFLLFGKYFQALWD